MWATSVASTVLAQVILATRDLTVSGSEATHVAKDATATSHDFVDATPAIVATDGAVGAAFTEVRQQVAEIERVFGQFAASTDAVVRYSGEPASVTGSTTTPPTFSGGEQAVIAVDGGSPVTTTFEAGDTTMALAAKRINYAHGAQVASVVAGALVLTGTKTGDAGAAARGWSHGLVDVQSGSALSDLGLSVGRTYGEGFDERVGPGPYAKTFPATALPTSIEVSGSVPGARLWVAGQAA